MPKRREQEIPEEFLDKEGFLEGRFISIHSAGSIAVDPGHERLITDARGNSFLHKESDPIICQFEQSGLRDNEIEVALSIWTFTGLPEGTNPITRIGVFDPELYSYDMELEDDERRKMERKLFFAAVDHPGDFAFVRAPKQPRPWPSYDSDSPEEIIEFQARLQIDPEAVRLYEAENEERPEILAAMGELVANDQRGPGVEVASVSA